MLMKKPKEKIKEVIETLDIGSQKTIEAIRKIAKNNTAISLHAKSLPKRKASPDLEG